LIRVASWPSCTSASATDSTSGVGPQTNVSGCSHGGQASSSSISRSTFCGVGCQVDLNVDRATNRIVKVTSDPSYLPNEGDLCVKGRFAFNFVHHPDRLTEPLVRGEDGELHETSWEHALEVAAEGLKGVRDRHGPQSIGFLASARLTMEENFLIQKLARAVIGTNSVHSCEAT